MRQCEYVEMNKDMVYWEVYADKKAFCVFMEVLLQRDCDTNSLDTSYRALETCGLKEEDVKKALMRLKKYGVVELYKRKHKGQVTVALRRCDDMYKIGDFELYLDDSLIIPIQSSKSRSIKGYDKFRKSVLKRDNYACQLCGAKENLEVHHKKSYAKYKRLRTTVSNGITLCEKCHDKVHSGEADIIE